MSAPRGNAISPYVVVTGRREDDEKTTKDERRCTIEQVLARTRGREGGEEKERAKHKKKKKSSVIFVEPRGGNRSRPLIIVGFSTSDERNVLKGHGHFEVALRAAPCFRFGFD